MRDEAMRLARGSAHDRVPERACRRRGPAYNGAMAGSEQIDQDAARKAAAVLAWYREMGIDAAVSDTAVDWLARGNARPGATYELALAQRPSAASAARPALSSPQVTARPAAMPAAKPVARNLMPVASPASPTPRQFPTTAPDEATLAARAAARSAATIDELGQHLAAFDGCALKATAKSLCFYRGAAASRLMVIGEAPGAEEDKVGKPFVGPAGQMLDKMLAAIGLGPEDAHVTNIVYWRPPGNRTPTPQEALICRPFLERQVELVKPEILLLLGGPSAKFILDEAEGIMKLRGKWRDVTIGAHTTRALATLHPAYLLRTPLAKRMAWRDMLAIDAALRGLSAPKR